MKFAEFRLAEPILRAVEAEGYTVATPIQAQAIPPVLRGRDVMGCAQTGTGKTAAFALPILHRLSTTMPQDGDRRPVRTLVLCPTRELAAQIADSFRVYGRGSNLRHAVVFGGVGFSAQIHALQHGVDILIATPGRLLDLIGQGYCKLSGVQTLVLDEADRMLDMGFIHDIRRIVSHVPPKRQTLMFSATMPPEIRELAQALLHDPVQVTVAPAQPTADHIDESVYFVERKNKPTLLAHLVNELPMTRAIVFTRTKHGADRVVRQLRDRGIMSEAIHGNKAQNARERAMKNFRANKIPLLVATDIASRGIDIDGITHVVNYDLTHEPETYVHRIGRTARAGAAGQAIAFCDPEELPNLKAIERLLKRKIPVKTDHPEYPDVTSNAVKQLAQRGGQMRQPRQPRAEHPQHAARPSHESQRSHERPAAAPRPSHRQGARPQHAQPAHYGGGRSAQHAPGAHPSMPTHGHGDHGGQQHAHRPSHPLAGQHPKRASHGSHPTRHTGKPGGHRPGGARRWQRG